jgi:imidazolonepropionase-like amidohydrolase
MIIKNAMVFLIEEKGFEKRDILVRNSKIIEVSKKIALNEYEDIYNASDMYITPGLIDAHSHIGLSEEQLGWEGDDTCENVPLSPQICAIDGINPFDPAFREALEGGVTVVSTGPGSASVIGGLFTTIKTYGKIVDEMVIDKAAAMKCSFGENPKSFGKSGKEPYTRMGIAALLRKIINDAIIYKEKKAEALKNNSRFEKDLGLENMLLVINKQIPLKAHAHRADDICTAIRIAKEFDLELTLDHCTEGHLIADYLGKQAYPAIVGPSFGAKTKIETKNKTFETVKILNDNGLKVCITTDHNVYPQQSLMMFAAMAKKSGLSEFEAMKAITFNPADVLKILDRKGQIKAGLDADLVIWNKHPFDLQSSVKNVFIEGEKVL